MNKPGESYTQLLRYWFPQLITSSIESGIIGTLYDAYLIGSLNSTSTFGALDVANNFLHMLFKLAESVSVATIALIGRYNGANENEKVGETLGEAFWTTLILGITPFLIIFFFATEIYMWLEVPPHMAAIGSPFLKIRGFGVLLQFMYLAFFGFFRGIKNTKIPMYVSIIGTTLFILIDSILVKGRFGIPALELKGSAIASTIQYLVMILICMVYILTKAEYKKYFNKAFFYLFSYYGAIRILKLSIPILIDKVSLSYAYVQLSRLINPMGKYVIATYGVVKNLERLAFLPAIAFATVITFLTSNTLGANDPIGARANIRKVLYLAGGMVLVNIIIISLNPVFFAEFFDPRGKFTDLVKTVFPIISIFVIFDFIQLILSGVLRGAGDVKTVMWIRFITCFGFFYPVSKIISGLPMESQSLKFILIYSTFYINTGLMGLLFIIRLKSKRWSTTRI